MSFALPPRPTVSPLSRTLERFAQWAAHWAGSSWAFSLAVATLFAWLLIGPWLEYSDSWQLAINTGTTIVTFLMVFLIQRAQNKDALAIQLKLNEIVAAMQGASNRLIDIEDLSESELSTLHQHFRTLASIARRERDLLKSHSVEEAETSEPDEKHDVVSTA
jgi:low affinity Fe/Cu permease